MAKIGAEKDVQMKQLDTTLRLAQTQQETSREARKYEFKTKVASILGDSVQKYMEAR